MSKQRNDIRDLVESLPAIRPEIEDINDAPWAAGYDSGWNAYRYAARNHVSAMLCQAADDAGRSAKYRHVAVKYLGWLCVKDPEACIEKDIYDLEMIGDLDTARQSQEKKA